MLKADFRKKLSHFCLEVSFGIEEKEYVVVLGKSGAGKSMIAKILAGIVKPDEGKILLKLNDITDLPPERRSICYLPQGNVLFPHMSVMENLKFPFLVRGKKTEKEKILELSKRFGIDKVLNKMPAEISGGEEQRVALVRTLLSDPEIIILDEPLNSLDFVNKIELIKFLKDNLKGKKTVIHITHDPIEAKSLGDRIFYVEKGTISFSGTWDEFIKECKGELPEKIREFLPLYQPQS